MLEEIEKELGQTLPAHLREFIQKALRNGEEEPVLLQGDARSAIEILRLQDFRTLNKRDEAAAKAVRFARVKGGEVLVLLPRGEGLAVIALDPQTDVVTREFDSLERFLESVRWYVKTNNGKLDVSGFAFVFWFTTLVTAFIPLGVCALANPMAVKVSAVAVYAGLWLWALVAAVRSLRRTPPETEFGISFLGTLGLGLAIVFGLLCLLIGGSGDVGVLVVLIFMMFTVPPHVVSIVMVLLAGRRVRWYVWLSTLVALGEFGLLIPQAIA